MAMFLNTMGLTVWRGVGSSLNLVSALMLRTTTHLGMASPSHKEVPMGEPGWQMQKSLLEASGMILQSCL